MAKLSEPVRVVPNIIPMIDIVSQLVIFFMLATQFVSADVDMYVKLPELTDSMAKTDKSGAGKLYVNVRFNPAEKSKPGEISIGTFNVTERARREGKEWQDVFKSALREYDTRCEQRHTQPTVVLRADRRLQWMPILTIINAVQVYSAEKVRKATAEHKPTPQLMDLNLCAPVDPHADVK